MDWFFWSRSLDASPAGTRRPGGGVERARGWQIGIVADGLLRTDDGRPQGQRMPIADFASADPDLRPKVMAKYVVADAAMLIDGNGPAGGESGLFTT